MALDFTLTSIAFKSGRAIPERHTCEGESLSPPLSWSGPPEGTKSFALIMDDPDAADKTFVHWILFNLPPDLTSLPEGVDVSDFFEGRSPMPLLGVNDYGEMAYGAPCPPPGPAHQYVIRLYALDVVLDLGPGVVRDQLTDAMAGHVLAEANIFGSFARTAGTRPRMQKWEKARP